MKRILLIGVCWIFFLTGFGQTVSERLQKAFQQFEADSQMKHGISSLYVIDANSGEVVFGKNEQLGFAPASTQKIITSVTAFEMLGKDFRYQTELALEKNNGDNILHVFGSGDPTFGSPRWPQTSEFEVLKRWKSAVLSAGVKKLDYVINQTQGWQSENIPDGWIWQDIGNYYGSGAQVFNWRENQFDIVLRSGPNIGDKVEIIKTIPSVYDLKLDSYLRSAAKGTGDNAYVYYPLQSQSGLIRGTIPVNEDNFKISVALIFPFNQFLHTLADSLKKSDIKLPFNVNSWTRKGDVADLSVLITDYSPSLDSIIYWFNKKSINLYGEALVKTMGWKFTGAAVTDSGVSIVKKFWKEKGIETDELNIYDGSGLSPLNRVTPHAQVEILKYAKSRDWFQYFFEALPIYNEMHMKSGTISDVKGFCGYHTSKEGREYIFSFLVNNYGGMTGGIVSKMYKVLDELK